VRVCVCVVCEQDCTQAHTSSVRRSPCLPTLHHTLRACVRACVCFHVCVCHSL
jgi:hypothetical protein